MVLLSGMMRSAAVWGRTDTLAARCAGRQGGRWADQMVRAAIPTSAPHARRTPPAGREPAGADPAEALGKLTDLHEHGAVTDAEFEALRARLHV